MAGRAGDGWDPVGTPPFTLAAGDKIATAGSCFAQHVSRHLRQRGLSCFITEPGHPMLSPQLAESFGYDIYSARYGNIYTTRQLLQLWRRATGRFQPVEDAWVENGVWFDPFRPTIQPGGFPTQREYKVQRSQHFAAVRRMFEQADVFIFTMGLTECWASRDDGAVFPLCPGVAAGTFDPQQHLFVNLSVDEVVADMTHLLHEVREVNPKLRLILTVSPVPLAATAEEAHVAVATCYSKAVLRVAAGILARMPGVFYFPAYEIVTAPGQDYFAADRRSVREAGVERVMTLFFEHLFRDAPPPALEAQRGEDAFLRESRRVVDILCEEALLDADPSRV
jgi:hypothetical protein